MGVVHAIVSEEIHLGAGTVAHGASRDLALDGNPIGFVITSFALCVLAYMPVAALLHIRKRGQSGPAKKRRRSGYGQ